MKCQNCGSDVKNDALFCGECGTKIERKKQFCRECGAKLDVGAKFCSNCGANVNAVSEADIQPPPIYKGVPVVSVPATENEEPSSVAKNAKKHNTTTTVAPVVKHSLGDKTRTKALVLWSKMDTFYRIATVAMAFFVLLLFIALLSHKGFAIFFSLLQIAGLAVAILMHKGIIKSPKTYLKYIIFAVAILFTILNFSYSWSLKQSPKAPNTDKNTTIQPSPTTTVPQMQDDILTDADIVDDEIEESQGEQQIEQKEENAKPEQEESKEDTVLSIAKGTEYAYMTDEWNVFIAKAISDKIIKIENWNKHMSNAKSLSYEYDVGTYKINDSEHDFTWVDDEHTTFTIDITDKNNSRFKKGGTATFTININDSDRNKGSNYSTDIACYSFQNDDWHLYRAIPMTDTLIKIEAWYRGSSAGTFLFGYDVCLIDTTSGDTDFEWTDDEHTSFTITMKDKENSSYWKKETFVVYTLENENYKHFDVKTYLGRWEVGEGEAAVPASAYDFKYEDYRDVQKKLEDAGFTNISTNIKYDIIWGWTDEGEVDSVSIDGRTDYEEKDVFKKDTPIIITYHMNADDDPNKPVEEPPAEKETPEVTPPDSESDSSTSAEDNSSPETEEIEEKKSPVFYSTNTRDTVDDGNSGVYSYKSKGGSYDIYWIIDFDKGYVYYFTEGNGNDVCDRLKIDSGDLNDYVKITYHDSGDVWSYKLHFKYVNHSEHLIMNDHNGFAYDYYTTDLSKALAVRSTKTIKDY